MCKQEGKGCSGKDCFMGSNGLWIQYGSSRLMTLKGVEGIHGTKMAAEVSAVYKAHKTYHCISHLETQGKSKCIKPNWEFTSAVQITTVAGTIWKAKPLLKHQTSGNSAHIWRSVFKSLVMSSLGCIKGQNFRPRKLISWRPSFMPNRQNHHMTLLFYFDLPLVSPSAYKSNANPMPLWIGLNERELPRNQQEISNMCVSPGFYDMHVSWMTMYGSHQCEMAVEERTNDTRVGSEAGSS